jgi:metal-sulfur cluster biosynthetic enzyme
VSTTAHIASGPLVQKIRAHINDIQDPCSIAAGDALGLEDMGLVEAVEIDGDGIVSVKIRLTSPTCVMVGLFAAEIQDRVSTLPGVRRVDVAFDRGLDWRPEMMSADARRRRAERLAQRHRQYARERAAAGAAPRLPLNHGHGAR